VADPRTLESVESARAGVGELVKLLLARLGPAPAAATNGKSGAAIEELGNGELGPVKLSG
jgi:hypothetical protein